MKRAISNTFHILGNDYEGDFHVTFLKNKL